MLAACIPIPAPVAPLARACLQLDSVQHSRGIVVGGGGGAGGGAGRSCREVVPAGDLRVIGHRGEQGDVQVQFLAQLLEACKLGEGGETNATGDTVDLTRQLGVRAMMKPTVKGTIVTGR